MIVVAEDKLRYRIKGMLKIAFFSFVSNGGKIYEELIKNKKANTKLKKYDKIIQRHIKHDVEEQQHYTFPTVNTGMHSDIRKILKRIMYG